jgi:DNA repair protein RecO (recombination protein O)
MPLVHDRCICLRKVEYSETSQILALLSRDHGLLRVIAKGAHRTTKHGASKFGGGIDLLDVGDAVFTHSPDKELATLCEWTLRDGHLDLRRNLRAMYLGLYAAELVATLIEEHDAHAELFGRLEQALAELQTPRVEEAFVTFELDLLRETGYLPQLESCDACGVRIGENSRAFFSPASGGVVCRNCEGATPDRIEVDPRVLRIAQGLLQPPHPSPGAPGQRLPRLSRHQSDPLNRILAGHIEHTLSKRLRLTAYVLGGRA